MSSELIPVERKLTDKRKKTIYMMRKSEALLRANMSNSMQDAWVLIEKAFQTENGHMGYGCHDLNHVKGYANLNKQERIQKYIQDYREWSKLTKHKNIVIDICVFGDTREKVSLMYGINPKTVTKRLHEGLKDYCKMMGWSN